MLALILALGCATADDRPAANDPRLFADYEALVAFLQKTPAYTLESRMEWRTRGGDGPARSGVSQYHFRLQRPGTYRLELGQNENGAPNTIVVSDGKTVKTLYTPKALYAEEPFTELLQSLGDNALVGPNLGGSLIDTLLRRDLVDVARGRITGATLLGVETVDGRALRHYRLKWRGDEEELWIGPEAEPLIRKLVRVQDDPEAAGNGNPAQLVTTTTLDWTIGPLPAGTFELKLPANARKVEDLSAAIVEDP